MELDLNHLSVETHQLKLCRYKVQKSYDLTVSLLHAFVWVKEHLTFLVIMFKNSTTIDSIDLKITPFQFYILSLSARIMYLPEFC